MAARRVVLLPVMRKMRAAASPSPGHEGVTQGYGAGAPAPDTMKDFFETLIDTANAKVALKRENERREADDLARTKAEGQRLADACYEENQPMFDAAVAAMRNKGIVASYERRPTGVLIVFDALETDAALKRLASSFEYAYFHGDLQISEVVGGGAAVARTVTRNELGPAFVAWMTAAMEARGARPARPRF